MKKRRCRHCFRDHFFERDEDDRDECLKCGGKLTTGTCATIGSTEVEVEAALVQDELAVLVENALEAHALTIWQRVDDGRPGDAIKVTDIAGRIASRIADNLRLVRLDERRLCRDCAAPVRDPEAEFDARCREALAAFKESPGRFAEATRAIVAERPQITMVEFIDRATKRSGLEAEKKR